MPYIKQDRRDKMDNLINVIIDEIDRGDCPEGEVNYVISRIASRVLSGPRYKDISVVVAAFECAKLEFYRRVASKLEDQAIQRNGDIKEYE
jgi:hypothetical protein